MRFMGFSFCLKVEPLGRLGYGRCIYVCLFFEEASLMCVGCHPNTLGNFSKCLFGTKDVILIRGGLQGA